MNLMTFGRLSSISLIYLTFFSSPIQAGTKLVDEGWVSVIGFKESPLGGAIRTQVPKNTVIYHPVTTQVPPRREFSVSVKHTSSTSFTLELTAAVTTRIKKAYPLGYNGYAAQLAHSDSEQLQLRFGPVFVDQTEEGSYRSLSWYFQLNSARFIDPPQSFYVTFSDDSLNELKQFLEEWYLNLDPAFEAIGSGEYQNFGLDLFDRNYASAQVELEQLYRSAERPESQDQPAKPSSKKKGWFSKLKEKTKGVVLKKKPAIQAPAQIPQEESLLESRRRSIREWIQDLLQGGSAALNASQLPGASQPEVIRAHLVRQPMELSKEYKAIPDSVASRALPAAVLNRMGGLSDRWRITWLHEIDENRSHLFIVRAMMTFGQYENGAFGRIFSVAPDTDPVFIIGEGDSMSQAFENALDVMERLGADYEQALAYSNASFSKRMLADDFEDWMREHSITNPSGTARIEANHELVGQIADQVRVKSGTLLEKALRQVMVSETSNRPNNLQ